MLGHSIQTQRLQLLKAKNNLENNLEHTMLTVFCLTLLFFSTFQIHDTSDVFHKLSQLLSLLFRQI